MRRNLNFRETVKPEFEADSFLKNCPPRSITAFVAIAINNLVKNYGLEDASSEEISKFIEYFDFIKVDGKNVPFQMVVKPLENDVHPVKEKTEMLSSLDVEKPLVSQSAKDTMSEVMASVFGTL